MSLSVSTLCRVPRTPHFPGRGGKVCWSLVVACYFRPKATVGGARLKAVDFPSELLEIYLNTLKEGVEEGRPVENSYISTDSEKHTSVAPEHSKS